MLGPPNEIRMMVLEGPSSQGLVVKTLFPTPDQRSRCRKESLHLRSQSLRHEYARGTVFEDYAGCSGSSA